MSTYRREAQERTITFAYDPGILPWIDMGHWPNEVATRQMVKEGAEARDQQMLAGRNPAVFEIRTIEGDSVSIKHPYRGTMYARIDEHGALQYFSNEVTPEKSSDTSPKCSIFFTYGIFIKCCKSKFYLF